MYPATAKRGTPSRAKVLASQSIKAEGIQFSLPLLIVVGGILLTSILCVWSRADVTRLGYEISRETKTQNELKEVNIALKAELARLTAPGRLEPIARKKLGLLPPENHQIVLMK